MTSARALLRHYSQTPKPVREPKVSSRLPPASGNATLSAPRRPDLRQLVEQLDESPPAIASGAVAGLTTALLGATAVPQRLPSRQSRTLVPSALDSSARATLSEPMGGEQAWFDAGPVFDEQQVFRASTAPRESTLDPLPRVLGGRVELTVFFVGLAIGVAVQSTLALTIALALR